MTWTPTRIEIWWIELELDSIVTEKDSNLWLSSNPDKHWVYKCHLRYNCIEFCAFLQATVQGLYHLLTSIFCAMRILWVAAWIWVHLVYHSGSMVNPCRACLKISIWMDCYTLLPAFLLGSSKFIVLQYFLQCLCFIFHWCLYTGFAFFLVDLTENSSSFRLSVTPLLSKLYYQAVDSLLKTASHTETQHAVNYVGPVLQPNRTFSYQNLSILEMYISIRLNAMGA